MITIPPQIIESFVPITAGLIISLINKYILNNPRLDTCCKTVEPEDVDSESDSHDSTKTELSDTFSRASGTTTATLPISHPIHTTHHVYYYTHQ